MEIILNVPFTCHISLQNVRYFPSIDATPFPQQYVNLPAKFQLDNILVIFQLSTSSSFQCILMVTIVNYILINVISVVIRSFEFLGAKHCS